MAGMHGTPDAPGAGGAGNACRTGSRGRVGPSRHFAGPSRVRGCRQPTGQRGARAPRFMCRGASAGGMEWWDPLVVVIMASTITSGSFSTFALLHARKESGRLADIQSANLIMKLREPWAKGGFKKFLDDARKSDQFVGREGEIEAFLNQMEKIAMFLEQKTLSEVHVKELFAENFKMIKANDAIAKYYDNARKQNEKYTFTNIAKVLKKMEAWGV